MEQPIFYKLERITSLTIGEKTRCYSKLTTSTGEVYLHTMQYVHDPLDEGLQTFTIGTLKTADTPSEVLYQWTVQPKMVGQDSRYGCMEHEYTKAGNEPDWVEVEQGTWFLFENW